MARSLQIEVHFKETSIMNSQASRPSSAGAAFRQAVAEGQPLQVVGAITAYAAKMAEAVGFKAV